jgi:hypothetical protein
MLTLYCCIAGSLSKKGRLAKVSWVGKKSGLSLSTKQFTLLGQLIILFFLARYHTHLARNIMDAGIFYYESALFCCSKVKCAILVS